MYRLGAGFTAGFDDPLDVEVALSRSGGTDADRLIGHLHMQGFGVGIGIDGDRGDAHAPGGADDAASDLAAIGDQHIGEQASLPWSYESAL